MTLFADPFTRIATAPISWGVCEVPGWGYQMSPGRVLAEMAELGFTHTELGSAGWLPESAPELLSVLAEHELTLLAAFVPLVLHDPDQRRQMLAEAEEMATLLRESGATYFNTAPVTSVDWEPRRSYTSAEWDHLMMMLGEVEEICVAHDLKQVIHEHFGCVVETADEIQRVLDHSSVSLVLDTGHFAVGGQESLEVIASNIDRVGLVHLKDTTMTTSAQLNEGTSTLMEAVQRGLFPALGRGDLPVLDIVGALEQNGYDGWYVIEQDCAIEGAAPQKGAGPMQDVAASLSYLGVSP